MGSPCVCAALELKTGTGKCRLPVRRSPSKLCATLDSSRRLRMDDRKHSISPNDLYSRLGSEAVPIIVDVRRDADFAGADTLVADAFHCSPDDIEQWRTE